MVNLINSKFDLITNLMTTGKSGTVTFTLPNANGEGNAPPITGLLMGDTSSIKLSNKWQAVLPSIDAITLASQIIDSSADAMAWLRSTQSAWMGSEPLRLTIPFYLFSMDASSNITKQVNYFQALMSPWQNGNSEFSVKIHGGYKPEVFTGQWTAGNTAGSGSVGIPQSNVAIDNNLRVNQGLITIQVGNQFRLKNMLLEDLMFDQSVVQVSDGNPLYIKVTASFKSFRVLFSQEIVNMFTTIPQ